MKGLRLLRSKHGLRLEFRLYYGSFHFLFHFPYITPIYIHTHPMIGFATRVYPLLFMGRSRFRAWSENLRVTGS